MFYDRESIPEHPHTQVRVRVGHLITEKGETVPAIFEFEPGMLVSVKDEDDYEYLRLDVEEIKVLYGYIMQAEMLAKFKDLRTIKLQQDIHAYEKEKAVQKRKVRKG